MTDKGNKAMLRSQLFKAAKPARETITLLTEDGPVEVDVVALSGNARGKVMNECLVTKPGEDDDDDTQEMDMAKLNSTLIIECTHIKGTDERLFTEADLLEVGESSATYFDPIIKTATRLSGIGKAARLAAEGNSAVTMDSTSGSPSHTS
jgi:hypothetical protein